MPGPHSHTNPPSVFTQWPSQEELKHSSISGKRENPLVPPTLKVVGVQGENLLHGHPTPLLHPGKEDQALRKSSCSAGSPRKKRPRDQAPSSSPADQMTERMAETEPLPTTPLAEQRGVGRKADEPPSMFPECYLCAADLKGAVEDTPVARTRR